MEIDRTVLLRIFLSDTEEELTRIEQTVLALENNPGDTATIGVVFRAAHTLKGNAATLALDAFAELAHALEDVLDTVRSRRTTFTPALATLVLRGVDGLRTMLDSLRDGEAEDRARYRALVGELSAHAAEARAGGDHRGAETDPAGAEELSRGPAGERWRPMLRIEVGKLDHLLGLATRLSVAQGQIGAEILPAAGVFPELWEIHERSERLLMELQDWVMEARMVPLAGLFHAHHRTIREATRSGQKQARLVIQGEQVRIDTTVGDSVRDALTHLVRNAIDHGIEPPAQRLALGKSAHGTITLRALQNGNQVVIQVSDDGAGLSLAKIRARARAMGRSNVDLMSVAALHRLVFEAGFSTADQVTELSGRGVGMDVVWRVVEALHGTVDIESSDGVGTTVELRLPLTVSVIEGFWVNVAGTDYVVPLDDVEECVELQSFRAGRTAGEGIIDVRDEPLPVYRMREIFGAGAAQPGSEPEQVVIVRHERRRAGLAVDAVHGQRQTVIRPLGRLFRSVAGISGSSLRPDGRVALVIDVPRLLRSVQGPGRDVATKESLDRGSEKAC